ncbi:MAG: hypothetical protein AB2L18_01560 [Anaerolineaceae bacterium]
MSQKTFEEFIESTLEIVNEFAVKNKLRLMFGMPNQERFSYNETEFLFNDKIEYSIIGTSNSSVFIRFKKTDENQYHILIDNGQISLTLDQDLKRLSIYPNDDFNNRIDNIEGGFAERLTHSLYIMWDIACFIVFLSKEMK